MPYADRADDHGVALLRLDVLLTATGTIGGFGSAAWAGADHVWDRSNRARLRRAQTV